MAGDRRATKPAFSRASGATGELGTPPRAPFGFGPSASVGLSSWSWSLERCSSSEGVTSASNAADRVRDHEPCVVRRVIEGNRDAPHARGLCGDHPGHRVFENEALEGRMPRCSAVRRKTPG